MDKLENYLLTGTANRYRKSEANAQ